MDSFDIDDIKGVDTRSLKMKKISKPSRRNDKSAKATPKEGIRLNKYIANAGICSRREADTFISAGLVSVNGEIVTELGIKLCLAMKLNLMTKK